MWHHLGNLDMYVRCLLSINLGGLGTQSKVQMHAATNRPELRSNSVWSKFRGCEVRDETGNLTTKSTQYKVLHVSVLHLAEQQAWLHPWILSVLATCQLKCAIPFTGSRARKALHSFSGWLGRQRLLKPTCVQSWNSRPKAQAPPGGEELQTFKLGLVSPQQKVTTSDFRV